MNAVAATTLGAAPAAQAMDAKDLVRTDLPRSSVFLDDIAELQSKGAHSSPPLPPPVCTNFQFLMRCQSTDWLL